MFFTLVESKKRGHPKIMEGNYRPSHSANSNNYSSAPADMDGANAAPFTVSYDQTGVNNPQAPQQSYSQAGNFAYNSSYSPASFSPAPVGPQFSYATSDAGYGSGSNVNMGSRVADAVRNIDTDRIAGNIESGIGYVTDKADKFTAVAKDKLANPNRRKALAIMGGAVASLALAMSLGNAVLNKTNSHSYDQTPPTATSNNSSAESNQTAEVKDTDPNMNVETADSEHDGKISYKVYKMYFPPNSSNGQYVLDHEGEVSTQYDDNDSLDARKEITGNDLLDKSLDRTNASGSLDTVLASNPKMVQDAMNELFTKYGDNFNEKYLNHYRNKGKNCVCEPKVGSTDDEVHAVVEYDLSKYLPDIRDGRTCTIIYRTISSSAKYTMRFGQRFQWTITPTTKLYPSLTYKNVYESDSIPTAKEVIEIIKAERKDTRNNENNSIDDGFATSYIR